MREYPYNCTQYTTVEFRIIIDLKIGSDLNIVVCFGFFFKDGNKAHLKSTKQVQKPVCIGKEIQRGSQQNSFTGTNFFYPFKILHKGFQNSGLLTAPIVKPGARSSLNPMKGMWTAAFPEQCTDGDLTGLSHRKTDRCQGSLQLRCAFAGFYLLRANSKLPNQEQ